MLRKKNDDFYITQWEFYSVPFNRDVNKVIRTEKIKNEELSHLATTLKTSLLRVVT